VGIPTLTNALGATAGNTIPIGDVDIIFFL